MNKIYKTVWCETTRSWVAVSEHTRGKRGGNTGGTIVSIFPIWTRLHRISIAALVAFGLNFAASPAAHAEAVMCANNGLLTNDAGALSAGVGVASVFCNAGGLLSGVSSWAGGTVSVLNGQWVGLSANGTQMVMDGGGGNIYFRVNGDSGSILEMTQGTGGVLLTGVAPGSVTSTSTDAINGSQLFSLSTSVSTGLSTISTAASIVTSGASTLASLSTGLSTTDSTVSSLSTSTSTGLSAANSSIKSLSTSTSTGLSSASSSITSLSTSASTSVSSLSTGLSSTDSTVSSLSTSTS
ncbi:ESPR-type extended signal peptide-containing protein, partial [Burkholderia cepacia]